MRNGKNGKNGKNEKGECPKYRIILAPVGEKDGGGWVAEVPELPGCVAQDNSPEAVLAAIQGAMEEWLAFACEKGAAVPEPILSQSEFSGKFTLRVPRSLHRRLSCLADLEGLSLNQYVLHLVSNADGNLKDSLEGNLKGNPGGPQPGTGPAPGLWQR